MGAGDGNRTRTISLGMSAGVRLTSAAAGWRSGDLVREYPRSTPGDLPIGHVAGTGHGHGTGVGVGLKPGLCLCADVGGHHEPGISRRSTKRPVWLAMALP